MANTKITTKELVVRYNSCKDSDERIKLIKSIVKTHYIPFEQKVILAKICVTTSNADAKTKKIIISSPATYLKYTLSILSMYTNLKLEKKDGAKDYDTLQEARLLSPILQEIGDDLKEFQAVLQMCKDDFMENEATLRASVEKIVASFSGTLEDVLNGLMETLGDKETFEIK